MIPITPIQNGVVNPRDSIMAKKKDATVTETEETQAPTKSLFAMAQDAPEADAVTETAADETLGEEATEAAPETDPEAVEIDTSASAEDLSVEELRRQAEEINRRLAEKTNAEKAGVLAQVVQVVGEYGITTEEVVAALGGFKNKRKGTPAKMKYRDPATGAEWSGRGKDPLWIRDKDRSQFLIADAA